MKKGPIILTSVVVAVFVVLLLGKFGILPIPGISPPKPRPDPLPIPPPPRFDRPIRVGIVTWGGYAGGIMANNGFKANKNCDFYRNYKIQVELIVIDDFVASRSAFKAGGDKGGIDIVWATVDAYALEYPALRELNPKCIMQYDWSRGGDAIAVDGNIIRGASDLRGKTISVAEDTPSHYFALFVLEAAGLSPRDVSWRFTNSAIDAANVFKAGRTDATVSWSPDVYIAARERAGGKILMSTEKATHLIADIFVARGDFIDQHPETIRSFINGWLDGVDKVQRNPKPVITLMAQGFGVPIEDSAAMLGDVHLPNYADNMYFFDSVNNPASYDKTFEEASKLWKTQGKIEVISAPKETRKTLFLLELADRFPGQEQSDPYAPGKRPLSSFSTSLPDPGDPIVTKRVTINFPRNSSVLDETAKSVIREDVASFVQVLSGYFVSIEGNTDNIGAYEHNQWLSLRRANSVKDFLVNEFNMPPERFDVKGNASDKPVASNLTEEGRAQNRRTDIVVKRPRN